MPLSGIPTLDLTTMGTFVAAADAADLLTCLNLYLDHWVPSGTHCDQTEHTGTFPLRGKIVQEVPYTAH